MIDHITMKVSDYAKSKHFYTQALQPIGYKPAAEYNVEGRGICGWAVGEKLDFWIVESATPTTHTHIALAAKNRSIVRAFYENALKAGGKDNGPPGLRELYHPHYFGAFVLDPDGNNIEAVCHEAEG